MPFWKQWKPLVISWNRRNRRSRRNDNEKPETASLPMTIHEFWRTQSFSYIQTYSLNRGAKLDALSLAASQQFTALRQQLIITNAAQLPAIRENLRSLEHGRDLTLMPLTDKAGAFQITASPVAKIAAGTLAAVGLAAILAVPVRQQYDWMCALVYRDALAFYDSRDNLCGVLNICFGCDRMITHQQKEIAADTATYQNLKQFLTELGHVITES